MLMSEAQKIMKEKDNLGYMVHFEKTGNGVLVSDYFPDKHAGEPLIKTELEAWHLARMFAKNTWGKCVNIYVIDSNFVPVNNYNERIIVNR